MKKFVKEKITGRFSQREIGRHMGCAQQTVFKWLHSRVPAGRVTPLCALLNWEITPHELRPDIYPNPIDGIPADKQNAI